MKYRILLNITLLLFIASCATKPKEETPVGEEDLLSSTDFIPLNISSDTITVGSMLRDIFNRDSLNIIDDFSDYLDPEFLSRTHLDTIHINSSSDTIYFRNRYVFSEGYFGSYRAEIWNTRNSIHTTFSTVIIVPADTIIVRKWEKDLIEEWNTDSIRTLTKPTFYNYFNSSYPKFFVYQIVIRNGHVKTRTMSYPNLYIPNELANDPEFNEIFE